MASLRRGQREGSSVLLLSAFLVAAGSEELVMAFNRVSGDNSRPELLIKFSEATSEASFSAPNTE
jgi:hypothetical protein